MDTQAVELRAKYRRFRVLIIGRANAGKTTILQKVCNSVEQPMIYDRYGGEIDSSVIVPSAERGEHDIENEMVFASDPNYVFHDSRGFESGSEEELKKVKAFIDQRATETSLERQLHAIWYCLPTDSASRLLSAADLMFFNECGTGKVPVVAIFTKFDDFVLQTEDRLVEDGWDEDKAYEEADEIARTHFDTGHAARLRATVFPPSAEVLLRGMHQDTATCTELIEKTAEALSDDALRLLFVSMQWNNLKLCTKYAIEV